MELLFNLEVVEGSRIRARPSAYLRSLPPAEQVTAVTEFLEWAEKEAANSGNPRARAEAEIGIATAREFLQTLQAESPRIYTGKRAEEPHD
jgi:hypothetical protein